MHHLSSSVALELHIRRKKQEELGGFPSSEPLRLLVGEILILVCVCVQRREMWSQYAEYNRQREAPDFTLPQSLSQPPWHT